MSKLTAKQEWLINLITAKDDKIVECIDKLLELPEFARLLELKAGKIPVWVIAQHSISSSGNRYFNGYVRAFHHKSDLKDAILDYPNHTYELLFIDTSMKSLYFSQTSYGSFWNYYKLYDTIESLENSREIIEKESQMRLVELKIE
jgi:hypothetical protein